MSLHYFDLHHSDGVTLDDEGRECSSLPVAATYALQAARGLLADDILRGTLAFGHRIVVRDVSGAVRYELPFRDAVTFVP